MTDTINYAELMHNAMRGLMADLLRKIGKDGLPGEHHFFICFDTTHPGVDIADWLRERHPEEMTIVIQHWFDNLTVLDDRFSISLNFNDTPEALVIPFDAIKTFVDPTVEFGLRFDQDEEEESYHEDAPESPMMMIDDDLEKETAPKKDADVVSLDSFRKPSQ
ncbi:MAG: ClpXP protease specificity-enhancing factor SspB [Amylibacter sp.]